MRILLFLLFCPFLVLAQANFSKQIEQDYNQFKESSLNHRRIKHEDLQPLINKLKVYDQFKMTHLGHSVEGRSINMISFGSGDTNVLLWSQMHGDEPTATMAIFDILNYLKKHKEAFKSLSIHFIPMLNPDGAALFTRRNALDIDINRDALRLQSPESKILKKVRDSLDADFGFNLHDQSKYYNASQTNKQATISFLAPAYNYAKDINEVRGNAMKVIIKMNQVLQELVPGHVGRYNDDFEPRAFGDNIQKWGTSTILIESGGYPNDPEKQHIRKLNTISILTALNIINNKSYKTLKTDAYFKIPRNDRKFFDLKIERLNFQYLNKSYAVDLGINHSEIDDSRHQSFYQIGRIADVGDLSTYYGYKEIDATQLHLRIGQTYPKIFKTLNELEEADVLSLLKKGYTTVAVEHIDSNLEFSSFPLQIIQAKKMAITAQVKPESPLKIGKNATFLLANQEEIIFAIINGFVYDIKNNENGIKNNLIR